MRFNPYQLKPGEIIFEEIRQYFVPWLPKIIFSVVWFLFPFFVLFPLFKRGASGVITFLAILITAIFYGLRIWHIWKNTNFVITDKRLIDIDQHSLFNRETSEIFYSDIDEVSYQRKGIFPTIFRYGTLLIKVRGAAADIEIRRVANPQKVQNLINELRAAAKAQEPTNPKEAMVKRIADKMSAEELEEMAKKTKEEGREKATQDFFKE